jgi:hypothetical protein
MLPQRAIDAHVDAHVRAPSDRAQAVYPAQVRLNRQGVVAADEPTQQAVEDWRYWVGRGYEF